jgi:hypothetical protein
MRCQDKNTSVADIVAIMADHIHVCGWDGSNSIAVIWVTKYHN